MLDLTSPDYVVWLMLHHAYDALKRCEDKVLAQLDGLTSEQYLVLLAIKVLGEPARVTDIARWTGRSVNSVSMLVDRMVKGQLLNRKRDKKDRRAVHITLAHRGRALIEPSIQLNQALIQRLLSPLAAADKTMLVNRLELLHSEASKYLDEGE